MRTASVWTVERDGENKIVIECCALVRTVETHVSKEELKKKAKEYVLRNVPIVKWEGKWEMPDDDFYLWRKYVGSFGVDIPDAQLEYMYGLVMQDYKKQCADVNKRFEGEDYDNAGDLHQRRCARVWKRQQERFLEIVRWGEERGKNK